MSGIITAVEDAYVDGVDIGVEHGHADRLVVLHDAGDPDGDLFYCAGDGWEALILGIEEGGCKGMVAQPAASVGGVSSLHESKDPHGPSLFVAVWTDLLDSINSADHQLRAGLCELSHERFR